MTDDTAAVRAANLKFYRAFTTQDLGAMDAIWAQRAPVICAHPGWRALVGREAVMNSWYNILSNPGATDVSCHDDAAFLYGDVAIVVCEEELGGGHFVATNIFVREDREWRMVHHQSNPLVARGVPGRPPRPN
jgi:ketosteroid isomerase-like protein